MIIQVQPRLHKDYKVEARDLDEAYKLGYFSSSMRRDELMERVSRVNPDAQWKANATHRGLWIRNKFVCGIGHEMVIPQFTIVRYDKSQDRTLRYSDQHGNLFGKKIVNRDEMKGRILMRSWRVIINKIKQKGYEVDDEDLF